MKLFEKILAGLFLTAVVMRLNNVLFAALVSTFSGLLLAQFYLFLGFLLFNDTPLKNMFKKEAYSGVKPGHIINAVVSGYGVSNGIIAVLFVLFQWAGIEVILLGCGATLLLVTGFNLILMMLYKSKVYKNVLWRSVAVLVLLIIITAIRMV